MDKSIKNDTTRKTKRAYNLVKPEIWKEIEEKYKTGNVSQKKLSEEYRIKEETIRLHLVKANIQKGSKLAVIAYSIAERHKQALIRLGLTPEDALKILKGGMTEPVTVVFEGKGEALQATTQPDYKTRLAYLQEYHKLVAAYPEPKQPEEKHLHFHFDPERQKTMDAEQVISEYQQMIQGGN